MFKYPAKVFYYDTQKTEMVVLLLLVIHDYPFGSNLYESIRLLKNFKSYCEV